MVSGMDEINVDFSQVDADEYTTVKPGEYDCTIKKVTVRRKDDPSKQTYPYLNFEMVIDEGQDHAGQSLFSIASLSTEGTNPPIKRTKFLLLTLGVEEAKGSAKLEVASDGSGRLLNPTLDGTPVHVWVNKREYDGQPRANVYRMRGQHSVGTPSSASSGSAESRYA